MISLLQRIFDLIAPRTCLICGSRLQGDEIYFCASCNLMLPRTGYLLSPYDNEMARNLWGRIDHLEKAVALIRHSGGSQASRFIYKLKYLNSPDIGLRVGQWMAEAMEKTDFLTDIDAIIPVPLAPQRERERGYNQSERIATALGHYSHKPVLRKVLARDKFMKSQTQEDRWERNDNVKEVFHLLDANRVKGLHVLLIDDVMTTGATVTACAQELQKAGDVRISVACIGFVDHSL